MTEEDLKQQAMEVLAAAMNGTEYKQIAIDTAREVLWILNDEEPQVVPEPYRSGVRLRQPVVRHEDGEPTGEFTAVDLRERREGSKEEAG